MENSNVSTKYLEVRSEVFGDVGTVALRQHHDLLLDVLNLVLGLLEVDDLDSDHLLRSVVDAFEYLAEAALPDPLLFGEYQLGVHLLQHPQNTRAKLLVSPARLIL